jgi:hypothetical protein
MRILFQSFHQQKAGNDPQEYEDSWSISDAKKTSLASLFGQLSLEDFEVSHPAITSSQLSLAIADGATESIFAKEWANLLVEQFRDSASADLDTLRKNVIQASRIWKRIVKRRSMPWYAEEKAKQGAFCTFLGLKISQISSLLGEVNAIGLGDCCLFQIRNRDLITSFPFMRPENFGNTPALLSSDLKYNEQVWPLVRICRGLWRVGDTFLLMTDALAQWFMAEVIDGQEPWNVVSSFAEDENNRSFNEWISDLRKSKLMKNDDVTLLVLKVLRDEVA